MRISDMAIVTVKLPLVLGDMQLYLHEDGRRAVRDGGA